MTTAVPNLEYSPIDLHQRVAFVKLVKVDDGIVERRDVVDTVEHPVLAGLVLEHDGANAANLHRGRIPKLDGASDTAVQVGEGLLAPSHVMRGAAVEVPPVELVVAGAVAEEDSCTRLVDLEAGIHQRGMRMGKIEAFGFPLPSSISSSRQAWAKNWPALLPPLLGPCGPHHHASAWAAGNLWAIGLLPRNSRRSSQLALRSPSLPPALSIFHERP